MIFLNSRDSHRLWACLFYTALAVNCSDSQGSTFTVTSTSSGGGPGTLRAAISNANYFAGADLINFNISGSASYFTISPTTNLDAITEPVTIDATTQPGYTNRPRIELNGASAGADATGLYLQTSNCIVKGLAINRFSKEAIRIGGGGGNTIQGNFIGTGPLGTNSLGNGGGSAGFGGITIVSRGNLIGGTEATNRNLISGSNLHGIFILNAASVSNQVIGNYIGVDVSGTKRLGNIKNGVTISGARYTIIGGITASARNIISGSYENGVYLNSDPLLDVVSISNVIQGNFVGTDASGTSSISNALDGIVLHGGVGNMIGGTNSDARNIISGNGGRGVSIDATGAKDNVIQGNFIGTDLSGTARLGNGYSGVDIINASSNTVGGAESGARNVISGNGLSGVSINDSDCTANRIQGNFIGTDVTGTNALGNSRNGVFVSGVTNNLIGGTNSGEGNLISGNKENGVQLVGSGCRGNLVRGNFIGTDITGLKRLGNGTAGVRIEAPANILGGATAAAGNYVSGNTNTGFYLLGLVASNNLIHGNYIGTTASGVAALGNSFSGITIENAPRNTIGGTAMADRNIISGNILNGVFIQGLTAASNLVQGNYIGLDITGTFALTNGIGLPVVDSAGGVDINGAPGNLIGGKDPGAGNVISGNLRDAISIGDAGASNNVIQGNLVGTKADGVSALGNEWHGVEIRSAGGGGNTVIGGAESGAGNVLAYATLAQRSGVRVRSGPGNTGVLVRGNSIFFNGGPSATGFAIDLGNFGADPSDECDTDAGANMLQNRPVLTNALSGGVATVVRGALSSSANTTYLLQFYATAVPEPSGNIQGKTYCGDGYVAIGSNCTNAVAFEITLPTVVPAGQRITATATDPTNNTSEFSTAITVTAAQPPGISSQPQSQSVPIGSNATFNVTASGTSPLNYQWQFNGTNLSGATASSLTLSNVQPASTGSYRVTVSNSFGTTNSMIAALTVQVNLPTLTVGSGANGTVTISWPTGGPAFMLKETTNVVQPVVWVDTTNTPVVTNGQFVVTLTPAAGNRFYRLVLP